MMRFAFLRYFTGVVAASLVRDSRRIGVEAVRSFASMQRGEFSPGVIEVDFDADGNPAALVLLPIVAPG